ncbi:hypothetical protein MTP99_002583 [Tenebrio molitor]|nr:hypothetical protein MTP99_002583 [Tenebrio molitor]
MHVLLILVICLTFYSQTCTSSLINLDNNACRHLYEYPFKAISRNCYHNPDITATTSEMAERNGYETKEHTVVTEDGYILKLFRVTSSQKGNSGKKQPVYLEHGILLDSDIWTFIGHRSLAYSLADDGYDVWLGNQRGNPYSRGHKTLKYTDGKYWDFNLDTAMTNDIRPVLKYIADETGMGGSIIYAGHSKGNTLMFMYASEYPEEAGSLLKGIFALSPIAYMEPQLHIKFGYTVLPTLGKYLKAFGIKSVFLHPKIVQRFLLFICPSFPHICEFIVYLASGKPAQFKPDDLLNFFGHFPVTTGMNDLMQFGQFSTSGKFRKFDYGRRKNAKVYGQNEPPEYDLGKIKVPAYLLYGKNDIYTSEKAIKRIYDELGSEKKILLKIPVDNDEEKYQFNHNDFFYARNITTFLYTVMRKFMQDDLQPNGE